MAKLIIHAGYHKTGTSAIQDTLCNNKDILWENGYFYPDPAPFNAHHEFASKLKSVSTLEDGVRGAEETLLAYKQHAKGRAVLLSSEMFSEQVDPSCFQTLPDIFDIIQIVFYIRQQDDLYESAYNQQVKQSKEFRSIEEYQPYRWDLYKLLKSYSNAIKGSYVYALEYNREVFFAGDLNADFFKRVLGLSYDVSNSTFHKKTNQSLSVVSCAILARLNKLSITDEQRIKAINVLMSEFPIKDFEQYSLLNDNLRMELMKKSEGSNENLRRDFLRSGDFTYINRDKIFLDSSRLNKIIKEKSIVNKLSVILDDSQYDLNHTLIF